MIKNVKVTKSENEGTQFDGIIKKVNEFCGAVEVVLVRVALLLVLVVTIVLFFLDSILKG